MTAALVLPLTLRRVRVPSPVYPVVNSPRHRPGQLVAQVQRDPGAAGSERVAEGDRAAVDVHLVMPDVQVTHGLDGDDRERLVDLDQVQVGYRPPGLGWGLPDGRWTAGSAASCPPGDVAVRADLGERAHPGPFGCLCGHHHDGGGAIGDRAAQAARGEDCRYSAPKVCLFRHCRG